MKIAHGLAVLGVLGMVLYFSTLLRPGDEERALMELQDANFAVALEKYEVLRKQGNHSAYVAVALAKIHFYQGDIKSAISIMEECVRENADSSDVVQYLGELYKQAEMPEHTLHILEQQRQRVPTPGLLRELARQYELKGDFEKEVIALSDLMTLKNAVPREDELFKLAYYRSVRGEFAQAADILEKIIKLQHFHVDEETLELDLDALMRTGRSQDALDTAIGFARIHGKASVVASLANLFRQYGKPDLSLAMLEPFIKIQDPRGEQLEEWVLAKIELKQDAEVFKRLSVDFRNGTMPGSLFDTLIDLALKNGDIELTKQALGRADIEELSPRLLVQLAETALDLGRTDLAHDLMTRLSSEDKTDRPLLVALLDAAASKGSKDSLERLMAVANSSPLDDEQRLYLVEFYSRHAYVRQAFALLKGMPLERMLANYDPIAIAELYAGVGEVGAGLALFDAANVKISDALLADKANHVRGLLLIALGDASVFDVWLKNNVVSDHLLDAAFDIAEKNKQKRLKVVFAELMAQRHPTEANRLQWIDALYENEEYGHVIEQASHFPPDYVPVQEATKNALIKLVGRGGASASRYIALFQRFFSKTLAQSGISQQEKREIGYAYIDAGLKNEAETIFLNLAQHAEPDHPDVQELLYLWGRNLSSTQVGWLKERALSAKGAAQDRWLVALENARQPQAILEVAEQGGGLNGKSFDIYVNALAATGDKQRLGRLIERQFSKNLSVDHLRRLSIIAENENLDDIAETGFHKVLELAPDDPQASRALGLYSSDKSRYSEATPLLASYLAKGQKDAQSQYAYAEILWRQKHYGEALEHYNNALQVLNANESNSLSDMEMIAHIFSRKGETEKAIQLFQEMLSKRPDSKELRADFADLLLEAKRYEEAKNILKDY